jgi:DUF971 family protein
MAERQKKRPAAIELAETELVVKWRDGLESRYVLEELRRQCPCASCRALREEPGVQAPTTAPGELSMIDPMAATATAEAGSFDRVGRYGIRINWADGHNYGIYTFEALRQRTEGSAGD